MVARGGASNASATPGNPGTTNTEPRRGDRRGSVAPPGLNFFSCRSPGVSLRCTPGYIRPPLRGSKAGRFLIRRCARGGGGESQRLVAHDTGRLRRSLRPGLLVPVRLSLAIEPQSYLVLGPLVRGDE